MAFIEDVKEYIKTFPENERAELLKLAEEIDKLEDEAGD